MVNADLKYITENKVCGELGHDLKLEYLQFP